MPETYDHGEPGHVFEGTAPVVVLPPHSIEAEQAVLGSILLSNPAFDDVAAILAPDDFYSTAHREIYATIAGLVRRGDPADPITVAESLNGAGKLAAIGGLPYLGALVGGVVSAGNAKAYAGAVRDKSIRRKLLALSYELGASAHARDGRSALDVVDDASRRIGALADSNLDDDPVPLSDYLAHVVEAIEKREISNEPPGLSTGLADLDALLIGLHPGDLVIVAGRPAMGKTTLAMGFATHAAVKLERPGMIFSLEMTPRALAERALANVGRVNAYAMRAGRMNADDWSRVSEGMGRLSSAAPLLVDGSPRLTVERIRARAKRAHRKLAKAGGLAIIVVDYLQLIEGAGGEENRNDQLSAITRGLKLLANELAVPVVALSQLSRKCEDRTNKRPMLSDLRDSGAIEQDADVVLFVYRDEVYHAGDESTKGKAEIIVGKHREGEVGTVYATFLGQHNRFADTEWRPTRSSAPTRPRADLDD